MTVLDRALLMPRAPGTRRHRVDASPSIVPAARSPRVSPALARRRRLERAHGRRILLTDAGVVLLAAIVSVAAGTAPLLAEPATGAAVAGATGLLADVSASGQDPRVLLAVMALAMVVVWWAALAFSAPRTTIGIRRREIARVAVVSVNVFGLLGIVLALTDAHPLYAQLFLAAPIGVAGLICARAVWGHRLAAERRDGWPFSRTLIVGRPADVRSVTAVLGDTASSGYRVVGAVEFDDAPSTQAAAAQIADEAARVGADAVLVASAAASDAQFIKRIGWCLEGTAAELIVANGLVGVARARMSLRAIDGLPLVHVRMPDYDGGAHAVKRVFDIAVSIVALTVIAVVLPVIALAIVADTRGPVFFAQERVGRDGRTFRLLKFRSMTPTAEAELSRLRALNEASGPLFKLRDDPRVTRVGRFLRRYSIDELPQFWNVLVGHMSVVGPRPPLPSEVLSYDDSAVRRLYVKPGITGPWQVGGRSDLTWDESVRIDLRYVENWSVWTDLQIVLRTAAVVVRPKGAY